MAIPSGSGTEVLKRYANQVQNTTQTAFTVDTNHIITILSIHATVMGGARLISRHLVFGVGRQV